MKPITGVYRGTGVNREIVFPGRPKVVFGLSDAAQFAAFHAPTMWCGRSNVLSGSDSVNNGCRSLETGGFAVGNHAQWNSPAGVDHHYLALMDTDVSAIDTFSYMGNLTDNRVIKTPQNRKVAAVLLKRDSTKAGILCNSASAAATVNSSISGTWVRSLGVGQFTVTAELEVNELDGPGGIGEEVTAVVFYEAPNVAVGTFTGDGAVGRVIATAGFNIKAALVWRVTPGGGSMRIATDTMLGKTKPAAASALLANEMALVGNTVVIGSSSTVNNAAGVQYGYLLLGEDQASQPRVRVPSPVRSIGKPVIELSGSGSYIDCGTADGPLLINGPVSVEWCGIVYPVAAQNTDCPLIMRGNGGFGAANGYSYGITAFRSADGAFGWPGPQFNLVTSDRIDNAPDCRKMWRTGIVAHDAVLIHVVHVHRGNGSHELYLNGVLVKYRDIDTTQITGGVFPLPNIASQSGHRTVIGARYSGGSFTTPQKMKVRGSRIYNRALSPDEVAIRNARWRLGSNMADTTSGLAEEWDAANVRGNQLIATVSAANNGTIVNGFASRL